MSWRRQGAFSDCFDGGRGDRQLSPDGFDRLWLRDGQLSGCGRGDRPFDRAALLQDKSS